MSISHAILGILSYKSLSGYDLKKIIQDSPFMHWSGNNNQIYKALVELHDEGFVTHEVYHQESSPSKKIYTITKEGLAELRDWVLSAPEPPEFKKTFLIQLAWADQLKTNELCNLLSKYEEEVKMQVLLHQEKKSRGSFSPDRTSREIYIWDKIYDSIISSYNNELIWVQSIQKEVYSEINKDVNRMHYKVINKNQKNYIESAPETQLSSEQDALDLIAACGEHDTYLLMLHAGGISEDFFKLKTGLAGAVLQKFVNYHVKVALIIPSEQKISGKFKELIAESNKGNDFRVFNTTLEAEKWLLNLK